MASTLPSAESTAPTSCGGMVLTDAASIEYLRARGWDDLNDFARRSIDLWRTVHDRLAPRATQEQLLAAVRQAVAAGLAGTECTPKDKGLIGEQLVGRLLARALPEDFAIASTAGKTARGDFNVTCPDGDVIVVESKNYSKEATVNARDVDKFYRDVSAADAIGGLLLSTSRVAGHRHLEVEIVDGGRVVVWLTERPLAGPGSEETLLALRTAVSLVRAVVPLLRERADQRTLSRAQVKRITAALARHSATRLKLRKNLEDMARNLEKLELDDLTALILGGEAVSAV